MKSAPLLTLTLAALLAACKAPTPPTCNDHFAGGAAPVITSESLAKKTVQLCYEEFAVGHSGISRTPLWSAEHLTAEQIQAARGLKRKNAFHAEDKLPEADRAELADYVRSGYDRGHLAPNGDMDSETAQQESFSLANIIPQHPKNNQRIWAAIEEAVRDYTEVEGQVYIVTGPIFEGESLKRLNGRVLIPTSVYKAIYHPGRKVAGAYVTRNAPGDTYETLSIAELETRIKINVFPSLAPEVKAAAMELPKPVIRSRNRNKSPSTEPKE
ncbi:DNA/RNA non-specific endonuclease [Oxalobacteraceae bacterium R-40]|uniref:Endonuclease n=1 Tax=Keguizhuia sedimenti TaxID=3064264 RepID=A0ABU1BUM6_9BURK|nr:DNA/RNA non-specific endonuclease [Oxalobacteraceae bacterium R-40]